MPKTATTAPTATMPASAEPRAGVAALVLGALYCLYWGGAELLEFSALPRPVLLGARLALLVGPPWLIVFLSTPRRTDAPAPVGARLLVLGVAVVGALPALFSTPQPTGGIAFSFVFLLPPGVSLGAALGYAAGMQARARNQPAVPAARRASIRGGQCFLLALVALPVIEIVVFVAASATGNAKGDSIIAFAMIALGIMIALCDGLFGLLLAVLGGALGGALAAWGTQT